MDEYQVRTKGSGKWSLNISLESHISSGEDWNFRQMLKWRLAKVVAWENKEFSIKNYEAMHWSMRKVVSFHTNKTVTIVWLQATCHWVLSFHIRVCATAVLQWVVSFESWVGLLEPRDWCPPSGEASWSTFHDSWSPQEDKRGTALAMAQTQNIPQWLMPCTLSCELTGFELLTPCLGLWAREWINALMDL